MLKNRLIQLRAVEPEDLNLLYEWENDVHLFPYNEELSFYSRAQMEQYIIAQSSTIYETGQQRFIIENTAKEAIGAVDLFEFNERNGRVGVGILVSEKYRGKEYATFALKAVIKYCAEYLLLNQIHSEISLENTASIGLFEAVGFIKTGTKKAWRKTKNGFTDVGVYQLMLREG